MVKLALLIIISALLFTGVWILVKYTKHMGTDRALIMAIILILFSIFVQMSRISYQCDNVQKYQSIKELQDETN